MRCEPFNALIKVERPGGVRQSEVVGMRKGGRETTTVTREKKKEVFTKSAKHNLERDSNKAEINSKQEKTAASDEDKRRSREGLCGAFGGAHWR